MSGHRNYPAMTQRQRLHQRLCAYLCHYGGGIYSNLQLHILDCMAICFIIQPDVGHKTVLSILRFA
jgi:hypothetical protein